MRLSFLTAKRAFAISAFYVLFTPVVLILSFILLASKGSVVPKQGNPVRIFSSLPGEYPSESFTLATADARVPIIHSYLSKYGSPLAPHAEKIVTEADKAGIDFRLLTAIARQESNLCKYAPEDTYNCWGWGIHKRGTLGFESFDEAIEVVSLGLKQKYIAEGLVTPEEIMSKYTPSSNGSWAQGVQAFLDDLQ